MTKWMRHVKRELLELRKDIKVFEKILLEENEKDSPDDWIIETYEWSIREAYNRINEIEIFILEIELKEK